MPKPATVVQHPTGVAPSLTNFASEAIDQKWRSLDGAPGAPNVRGLRGVVRVAPNIYFRAYANGRIYSTPQGVTWVQGIICTHYVQLGGPGSWLGLPISDEVDMPEEGKVTFFQNGAIYWWLDTGPRALNDVIVHYTGLHCFGETDVDHGTDSDEPYATLGVAMPDGTGKVFRSRIYEDVDSGEGCFEVIELYRGKPVGLAITSVLQEDSDGDKEMSRAAVTEAVNKGGPALAEASANVPVIGAVLGPLASVAFQVFKGDLISALNSFLEGTLGLADRPLGSHFMALTPKQMVVLATRPEGHSQFNEIPWRFETGLLSRFGATYKLYFNIFPA